MQERDGKWVTGLPELIRMNQLVRGRIDLDGFDRWYDTLLTDQRVALGDALFALAYQARPTDPEYDEALATAGVPTDHPVVRRVWEARRDRSFPDTFAADRFLASLNENDLRAAFRLFAALFGVAQWREYRTLMARGYSRYWWHRDVLDQRVVDDLLSDPSFSRTTPRDDERIKSHPPAPRTDECPQGARHPDVVPDHVVLTALEPAEPGAEPPGAHAQLPNTPAGGSDGEAANEPCASDPKPLIHLVGLDDEFRGREWVFHDCFHVGRVAMEPPRGLTLDAPSANSVSRLHATVAHDEVGWWVTDRQSTNGTYLNGAQLGVEPAGPLRAGDVVRFAHVALRVERASGSTEQRRGAFDSTLQAGSVIERALTNAIDLVLREAVLTRCGCARRFAHLFRPEHLATVERAERTADGVESAPSPRPVGSDPLTALVNALTEEGHDLGQWLALVEGGLDAQVAERTAQQAIHRECSKARGNRTGSTPRGGQRTWSGWRDACTSPATFPPCRSLLTPSRTPGVTPPRFWSTAGLTRPTFAVAGSWTRCCSTGRIRPASGSSA
jgi:pSer/pThr/pTyr-binding forkhead associated (FHA) protein